MTKRPEIGSYLTAAIATSGLPQKEIARRAGFKSANILSMMKSGETKIPIARVPNLAAACGVPEIELLEKVLLEDHPEMWEVIGRTGCFDSSPTEKSTSEIGTIGCRMEGFDMAPSRTITPVQRTNEHRNVAPPFPEGPFRFLAIDVETANHDRASICQIGVACVRPDNTIETWVTYIDPEVDHWAFTDLHKISARTVQTAPRFHEVLPILKDALREQIVYQHSNFDRSAIKAACRANGLPEPAWDWHDSVQVSRSAWPELKGNGGHGLASLKTHLGLSFEHHDAGEDARAAAEIVLHAESGLKVSGHAERTNEDAFEVIREEPTTIVSTNFATEERAPDALVGFVGKTTLTEGNIKNCHIYLRGFFDAFPSDVVGGSNVAAAAQKTICIDWGGDSVVNTDLDGKKKFFRKRGWVRDFFAQTGAVAGDMVLVEMVRPYFYRVTIQHAAGGKRH